MGKVPQVRIMTVYGLKREGFLPLSRRFTVYRLEDGSYAPLRAEDYNQGLTDFLTGKIQDGTLKEGAKVRFQSTGTAYIHRFSDSFLPLAGWFYDEIRDGRIELRYVGDTVRAFTKYSGVEVRVGE